MKAENWKRKARQRETQAGTLKRTKKLSKTRAGYTNKKITNTKDNYMDKSVNHKNRNLSLQ